MTIKPMEICSANALNKNSVLTVSEGDANKSYLFDNEKTPYWQSDTASDLQTETITVEFKDINGSEISKDIDRLILENTNIKYLTAQIVSLDDTTTDIITTEAQTLSGENIIIDFTPLDSDKLPKKIIISLHTTQVSNEKKKIGELRICKKLITLDDMLVSLSRNDDVKAGFFRTTDGSAVSWQEWSAFSAELSVSNVSQVKKETLENIYRSKEFITLIYFNNESTNKIESTECGVISPPNFMHSRTTNLYDGVLVLKGR